MHRGVAAAAAATRRASSLERVAASGKVGLLLALPAGGSRELRTDRIWKRGMERGARVGEYGESVVVLLFTLLYDGVGWWKEGPGRGGGGREKDAE